MLKRNKVTMNIKYHPPVYKSLAFHCLFEMINLIADKLITHKVNAEKLYEKIQNLNQKNE